MMTKQTFGQKAVGISFNPSGNQDVDRLKILYAGIIDILDAHRGDDVSNERERLASIAITEAQTAQMWAVKAVTWKEDA